MELAHHEKLKIDGAPIPIFVPNSRHPPTDDCGNPQLFVQLTRQRILGALSRLDLASGKLPLQRHGLVAGALADQNLLVFEDQRRYYSLYRHRVTFFLLQAAGTSLRFVAALWDAMVIGKTFIGKRLID